MRRWALLFGTLLAGFCVCVFLAGSMLIAPSPAAIPDKALTVPHESVEFRGPSGNVLHGWFVPTASDARGTVVLMHGVRANRLSMVGRAAMLHRAGYAVLLFDFQAHGESPGDHITMGWLESGDARAAVAYARSREPGKFVAAIGVSLGGAAALLGAEPLAIDALVLEAVYPDIEAATANRLGMRLGGPGRLLAPLLLLQLTPRLGISAADLRPISGISRVRVPLLIIAGGEDRHTTPADSARLFAAAPEPKQLWMIPGAAHVDFEAYSGRMYAQRVLAFFASVASNHASDPSARDLRIENVTIVSPERSRPLPNVTVTIHDGRIASITPAAAAAGESDADVIDARGLYLIPGLIDSHVHTDQVHGMTPQHEAAHPDIAEAARRQNPRSYLYFGFTTLIDLISVPERIQRWNELPQHPDLYFCGATPIVDGYPMVWAPKPERYSEFPYLIVQRGEEATAPEGIDPAAHTPEEVVSRMQRDGASCVKTFYERGDAGQWPTPRLDTIRALVKAAHDAHLPVFIHATSTDAQEFALQAGVDVIAHGLWSWTDEGDATELTPRVRKVLDGVLKARIGWQPTLQVSYGFRDLFDPEYLSDPLLARVLPAELIAWYRTPEGQWFHDTFAKALPPDLLQGEASARWDRIRQFYAGTQARARNATRYLAQHDGRLLFGTDTPSSPLYTNPPGLNGRREMNRLVEAGLTPAQVFRAATLANAEAVGRDAELGTVQVGKRANLLLVREDPTRSIRAYDEIVKVILHGRALDRSGLAALNRRDPD